MSADCLCNLPSLWDLLSVNLFFCLQFLKLFPPKRSLSQILFPAETVTAFKWELNGAFLLSNSARPRNLGKVTFSCKYFGIKTTAIILLILNKSCRIVFPCTIQHTDLVLRSTLICPFWQQQYNDRLGDKTYAFGNNKPSFVSLPVSQ